MRARILHIAAAAAFFGLFAAPSAHADTRWSLHVGVGSPVVVAPAPIAFDDDYGYWQPGYYTWAGYERRWVPGYWVGRTFRDRSDRDRWERRRWERDRREREHWDRDRRFEDRRRFDDRDRGFRR